MSTKTTLKIETIKADTPTVTGRIYTREALQNAVDKYQERIENGTAMIHSESDHPPTMNSYLGKVNSMELGEDGHVKIEVTLDSPVFEEFANKDLPFPGKAHAAFIGSIDGNVVKDPSISHVYTQPE